MTKASFYGLIMPQVILLPKHILLLELQLIQSYHGLQVSLITHCPPLVTCQTSLSLWKLLTRCSIKKLSHLGNPALTSKSPNNPHRTSKRFRCMHVQEEPLILRNFRFSYPLPVGGAIRIIPNRKVTSC